ncbi:MAG: hypothetical protein LBR81_01040 [Prevotellaceae bacterium]|jgi:hypothetical protein|nr:hypothetical protein [Prevotellaceae bacterium]
MNDKQNAKLNMADRVSDTAKRYETVYEDIAPMKAAVAELNADISNIREVEKEQGAVSIAASTLTKQAAESLMIQSCVKLANVLYVIGFTSDNKELISLQGLSENSFYRMEDNAKLAKAQQLGDRAQEQASELKNYGIDEAEITAINASINAYEALISKPLDAIGVRKQKTTNLVQLFAALDSTLYDKLDKLMVLFKNSQPDFYSEYRTARNIINTSARSKKKEEEEEK